jgi:DNA-binding response OmpR family regulator
MRVLVAEDERVLADRVTAGLRKQAMAVDVAYDGESAWDLLTINSYDVCVLDRDLPRVHGDEICARLVARGALTRVLMLTAAGTVADRVEGLGLGADDYLAKPFDYPELVARIRALGRRSTPALPPVMERAGIVVDTPRRQAFRDGRYLNLSGKEFAVLEVLVGAKGSVVSSEQLLEKAWDENTDPFTNSVRVTMSKLRAKLGDPPVITTVHGAGYRL